MWLVATYCTLIVLFYSLVHSTFVNVRLRVKGNVKNAVDFSILFRTTRNIFPDERIAIVLPRFTQRLNDYQAKPANISYSDLIISPSLRFQAQWLEGINVYGDSIPYPTPLLMISTLDNATIVNGSFVRFTVYKENGIGAVCGFASSSTTTTNTNLVYPSLPFTIGTLEPSLYPYTELALILNTTYDSAGELLSNVSLGLQNYTFYRNINLFNNDVRSFDAYDGLGNGCEGLDNCNSHGSCDYCYEQCRCFQGYGHADEVLSAGYTPSIDCSERVCPAGKAFGDLPVSSTVAHRLAECSNNGLCNRATGQCSCFAPFNGSACEKLNCPRSCSGHGSCMSMADIARIDSLAAPTRTPVIYGSGTGLSSVAWDYQSVYGCVCDSAWPVGFDTGQIQLAQYFGPDCSLKRCPSGDDPFTSANETDCTGKNQLGGSWNGRSGNGCHIDCSNRGVCDYSTGTCTCFPGSWGTACEKISNAGKTYSGKVLSSGHTVAFSGN